MVATSNPHKIEEIVAVVGPVVELLTLRDAGLEGMPEPVEDALTFAGNARIKAEAYAAAAAERGIHAAVLADDSGLAVAALNGEPGVRSARYAGVEGDRATRDAANNVKLLTALQGIPAAQRAAAFVCAVCLVQGDALLEAQGEFEGQIITPDQASDAGHPARGRGTNGFGYDPLFWLPDRGCTAAELPPHEKNAISHRGRAVRALWGQMDGRSSPQS